MVNDDDSKLPIEEPSLNQPMASARTEEFVRLMTENRAQVFRFVYSILPDHSAAEEVFQRASIIMWRKFDNFELGTNFQRWAKQIAYYEVLEYRRVRGRERLEFWPNDMVDSIANTCLENEDLLNQMSQILEKCVEKLSGSDRELVKMRYQAAKMTSKAVAEKLGRPKVTVYKALERIRRVLYECIQRTLAHDRRA